MAWTDPKTWFNGQQLTAEELNQYLRDNLAYLYALLGGSATHVESGLVNADFDSATPHVTFAAPFASAPAVVVSWASGEAPGVLAVSSITTTGFTIESHNFATVGTRDVCWMAAPRSV